MKGNEVNRNKPFGLKFDNRSEVPRAIHKREGAKG
jgi:hypothetical protein